MSSMSGRSMVRTSRVNRLAGSAKKVWISAFPVSVKCVAFVTSCGGSLLRRLRWPSMVVVRECLAVLARS